MNWVDSQLLVYALVAAHPARPVMVAGLTTGDWASTAVALLEVYRVLTRDYAFSDQAANDLVESLGRSPIHWEPLDSVQAGRAVGDRSGNAIDSVDAVLLGLARADRGALITQDRRLLRAAVRESVAVRNPIGPQLALAVTRWEDESLAPKGLARMLSVVERWIRARQPALADRLREATSNHTMLSG